MTHRALAAQRRLEHTLIAAFALVMGLVIGGLIVLYVPNSRRETTAERECRLQSDSARVVGGQSCAT